MKEKTAKCFEIYGCDRCDRMGWDYVVTNRKKKCSKNSMS